MALVAAAGMAGTPVQGSPGSPSAGTGHVYVTSPSNQILRVDFEGGTTSVVVQDKGRNFQGLTVRRDGPDEFRLIVASSTQGGDLRIYDPDSGEGNRIASFRGAHGVAVSQFGQLFAVNEKCERGQVAWVPRIKGCDLSPSNAGCHPGGYGDLQFIDEDVRLGGKRIDDLRDVRVATTGGGGLVEPGELLVLVESPPMVLAYTPEEGVWDSCQGNCEPRVVVPSSALRGYQPSGLEVASGSILVTTAQGVILKATPGASGGADVEPFLFLPGKGAKLSLGVEDGEEIVYATVPNKAGEVDRFSVDTGALLGSVKKGIKVPEGVGNEASAVVLTQAGSNVKVALPTMNAVFDKVDESGETDALCDLYPVPDGWDFDTQHTLRELGFSFPDGHDVVIPPRIRPFRIGNPTTGPFAYYICHVANTALFSDTYELTEFESQIVGYMTECETFNEEPSIESRMFYAPDLAAGEPNIAEAADLGNLSTLTQFTDVSTDCGCNVGRGWKFSYVMPASQDLRSVCAIEQEKVQAMKTSVTSDDFFADFIDGPGCGTFETLADGPFKTALQATFERAGLGPLDGWNLLDRSSTAFWGEGGNGLLLGGGAVSFELRDAGFFHAFGISTANGTTELLRLNPDPDHPTFQFQPGAEPYRFYFENLTGNPGRVYSDDAPASGRDILIFENKENPGLFALLYDDGGAGPDRDYNDLVLTAEGEVNTQCKVESKVNRSFALLDESAECTDLSKVRGVLDELTALGGILKGAPGDFDNSSRNVSGELDARIESAIFMGCKFIEGDHPSCPLTPATHHMY
jgi:hypothetical protein